MSRYEVGEEEICIVQQLYSLTHSIGSEMLSATLG